jgi:uncharacterized caspase-like protein
MAGAAEAATERVALIIGNGAYQSESPLANPSNDAADVAALLRNLGFEVIEGRDLSKRDARRSRPPTSDGTDDVERALQ